MIRRTAELEKRNRDIKELAHKTIEAMENERRALSKELHDSIGGTLAAIKLQLEGRVEAMTDVPQSVSMSFEKMIDYLGIAIRETRRITKQLRPSVLDDFGLTSAVEECIRDFEQFYPNIKILRLIGISDAKLSSDIKTVLYRVVQESLNNVGKHSQAENVYIQLARQQDSICLQVRDDGIGFDPDEVMNNRRPLSGYGVHSMRERVEICKGEFQMTSQPDRGTSIHVSIPVSQEN